MRWWLVFALSGCNRILGLGDVIQRDATFYDAATDAPFGEWTLDWYAAAYDNPCNDCAHLTATRTGEYCSIRSR